MDEAEVKILVRETVREVLRAELGETQERSAVITWAHLQMEKEREWKEMKNRIKTSLMGQIVIWITIGIGIAVWTTVKKYVR